MRLSWLLFLHVLLTGFEILIVLVDSGFDHGELFHLGKILPPPCIVPISCEFPQSGD